MLEFLPNTQRLHDPMFILRPLSASTENQQLPRGCALSSGHMGSYLLIPLMTLCLHHKPSKIPASRQSPQSGTHPIWAPAPNAVHFPELCLSSFCCQMITRELLSGQQSMACTQGSLDWTHLLWEHQGSLLCSATPLGTVLRCLQRVCNSPGQPPASLRWQALCLQPTVSPASRSPRGYRKPPK